MNTPDHTAWSVDTAGVTQIRVWILPGSHTGMGIFLASQAHDVTQTGRKWFWRHVWETRNEEGKVQIPPVTVVRQGAALMPCYPAEAS